MADVADLNPEFASRLAAFRAGLSKAGIETNVVSGYRSPEYQSQLYANYQARQSGQPLPYPKVNQGSIAAPAWQSFHNYGLAADVTPANSADYSRMWDMASQYGLTALGKKDIDHFQMAGDLNSLVDQYKLANWRPESQPAPAQGAVAYNGPTAGPSRPTSPTPGTTLFAGVNPDARGMRNNNPGNLEANSWTSTLPGYQGSDGRFAIFDTPQHGAGALDQNLANYASKGISTPLAIASTWAPASDNNNPNSYGAQIAKGLGVGLNDKIDLSDPAVRSKISQSIALVENGPGKSAGINVPYGTTLNVAQNAPVTTAPGTASAGSSGSPASTAATSALPGFAPAQSNQFLQGASGLDKAMGGKGLEGQPGYGDGGQDQMRPSPMIGQAPAPHIPNAQAAAQTFGTTLNSIRTPLQWGSGTPGSPISATAGPQVAAGVPQGMTAQELQQMQQLQMMQMMGGGMGTTLSSPYGGGYG